MHIMLWEKENYVDKDNLIGPENRLLKLDMEKN